MARASRMVLVGRGQQSRAFDMKGLEDDEELARALLGPSGNLRAPTLKVGDTLLVGWCEPGWLDFFGETS